MAEPLEITTADGRTLEVLVGQGDGFPLVYHSGSPSAAVPFPLLETTAGAQEMRMITYSRPGYGRSSAYAVPGGARLRDDVTDALTILDELGVGEFVTLGWSGGGPRALACAALVPDRCLAAAAIASPAPRDAEGLDWSAGMDHSVDEELAAMDEGLEAYSAFVERDLDGLADITAEELRAANEAGMAPPVDAAATTPEIAEHISASFRHALRQGVAGARDDGLARLQPWGFDLAAISVPVSIWQGSADQLVPFGHGRWLADHVPGARAHLIDGEGHVSITTTRLSEVLTELRELAGLAR